MTTDTPYTQIGSLLRAAIAISVCLLAARLALAEVIGFGDAEALYASYAIFKQATYLDHPGLIGWIGSLIAGDRGSPSPIVAHRVTSIAATAVPWLSGVAARCAGASNRGAIVTVVAVAIVPEIAIGLFAFTPDLPLAFAWFGALAFASIAIRTPPSSAGSQWATIGAGLFAGVASASKASGVLLAVSLAATWLSKPMRTRLRTVAPYAAVFAGFVTVMPMVYREVSLGWPMLTHRLVSTQAGLGLSMRNIGALIGGQLLYLTPFVAAVIVIVAFDLFKHANDDPINRLLFNCSVPPFIALAILTALSRVAEPHWIAPAYLALALHLGRSADRLTINRKLVIAAIATSILSIAIVFSLVRYPILPKHLGKHYEARYDLVNDLYAWQSGGPFIEEEVTRVRGGRSDTPTIVGPHWIICAQVQAAIGKTVRVGCETPQGDDFQIISPRSSWEDEPVLLFVTDDRFPVDLASRFPDRTVSGVSRTSLRRGGVTVRTIRLTALTRAAKS